RRRRRIVVILDHVTRRPMTTLHLAKKRLIVSALGEHRKYVAGRIGGFNDLRRDVCSRWKVRRLGFANCLRSGARPMATGMKLAPCWETLRRRHHSGNRLEPLGVRAEPGDRAKQPLGVWMFWMVEQLLDSRK